MAIPRDRIIKLYTYCTSIFSRNQMIIVHGSRGGGSDPEAEELGEGQ
jgi:hypothetical protein